MRSRDKSDQILGKKRNHAARPTAVGEGRAEYILSQTEMGVNTHEVVKVRGRARTSAALEYQGCDLP